MLHIAPATAEMTGLQSVAGLLGSARLARERLDRVSKEIEELSPGRKATEAELDARIHSADLDAKAFSDLMRARPSDAGSMITMIDAFMEREAENIDYDAELLLNGVKTFLKGLPAASISAAPAINADAELIFRGFWLDSVEARYAEWVAGEAEGDNPHFEASWKARERVNALPAHLLPGLAVKAKAAITSLERDEDLDCRGAGSFVDLAESICADILRLDTETAKPVVEPAEELFGAWLDLVARCNAPCTAEEEQVFLRSLSDAERAVLQGQPSIQNAGAIILHELAFAASEDAQDRTPAEEIAGNNEGARFPLLLLRCLRPHLGGKLAEFAADILDNPDRRLGDSLLSRAFCFDQPIFREAAE